MEKCRGGSSLVNCSELVQAVIEYMKDNYPNNPEEFNFQAELKAACHWYWTKDGKALKEGPHVNCRIKTAAMKTLTKWRTELKELTRSQKQAESQRITGKVLFSVKSPMVLSHLWDALSFLYVVIYQEKTISHYLSCIYLYMILLEALAFFWRYYVSDDSSCICLFLSPSISAKTMSDDNFSYA